MRKVFTKINVAKFAMVALLLAGGSYAINASGFSANAAPAAAAEEVLEVTSVTPDPSLSMGTPLEMLKEITVTFNSDITSISSDAQVVVTKDGDKVADASLRSYGKSLTIVFNAGLTEYGQYKVVIPENCVTTALGNNAELPLMFNVGEFAVAQITPSVEEVAKSLSEVTVFMTAPVGGFLDGAKLNVKRDGDVVATATLDWATEPYGNDVRVTFDTTLEEYGKYTIEFPAGVIFDKYYNDVDPIMSGARGNEAFELTYKVGLFEVATIAPSVDETAESLSEVTVFMTAPVGGFLDGAKLNVYKDGDTEEAYTTATLDWATEPYGNDVRVTFDTTLEEYGKYTIEFPAGVIFDKYYTDVDPIFSGARGNEAFELTYKVGTFAPVSVLPATDEALESLKEVTVFMSDRVGGVLDGAKLNVYKDGDTEEAYTTATIDILNTNANEATITLADEITEYGKYTIVIPEGIIFDKYYNGEDAAMTGATGNEAFELTYNVGSFEVTTVSPSIEEVATSLKEVTVFMSDRVGGFLDGAKLNVKRDGDVVATATLDWATEPYGNDVRVTFDTTLEEYGKYTIEFPAGVIFDKYYNDVDPIMSGARSNDAFELTYNVGLFEVAAITPSIEEVSKTLNEVTVFMTAPVGGFLDGAKLNVKRDGDVVATATLDWATEPYGNDVRVTFDTTLEEYGKYTIEFPAGVIFDKYYNDVDPIMSGARSNDAFELTYKVGLFEVAAVTPENGSSVNSLKDVTVFMTAPVGGFLDGAELSVTKDGAEVATATLDWATEPYGNDVVVLLSETLTESGVYTIEIPAGVIFDKYYTDVDPLFSGARTNDTIVLTFTVDTSTGISNVTVKAKNSEAVYTLGGMKVGRLVKGINIVNGKKVLVK